MLFYCCYYVLLHSHAERCIVRQRENVAHRCVSVCEVVRAHCSPHSFITFGDKLADSHPAYFCMHCYHPLHYASDGTVLDDDFHVMPYFHS